MDLLFYRQYPELATNSIARYQFYMAGWRSILTSVIDDQLIMADAEEKKVEVSDGEVREELESLFGPDVVLNLDKLGMSLGEAFELLKTELIVQKMMGIMVRSRALMEVHPIEVRQRYEKWCQTHPAEQYWVYQVLSVKGSTHQDVAREAYRLITEENSALEMIPTKLKQEGVEITLSEEYSRSDKEISKTHKAILQTLAVGQSSLPDFQKESSRILCLKKKETKQPASFNEMEDTIKKEIMEELVARHNGSYREKLRDYYGLTELVFKNEVPQDLEPFALR